jgi:hypothetical protein
MAETILINRVGRKSAHPTKNEQSKIEIRNLRRWIPASAGMTQEIASAAALQ